MRSTRLRARIKETFDRRVPLWYQTIMLLEQITPRFGDIDGLRHVNNTVIPGWFEQARNPIYRIFNPEFVFESWNLILVHYDFAKACPVPIPEEIRARLREHLTEPTRVRR